MISEKKLKELKNLIINSKNPVFLFDNDPDGICSAAILLRNIRKGNFFVLKSIDKLNKKIKKKILSLCPSEIFFLDKPFYEEKFIGKIKERKIKIIFIDHHEQKIKDRECLYFNSYPSSEPVSYITQKIFNSKDTIFLSLIGCISDVFLPEFFYKEKEKYPELFNQSNKPLDIIYSSNFGKIIKILSLSLKNKDNNIVKILYYLAKSNSFYDILIEKKENQFMHEKYKELNKIIENNIKKIKVFDSFVFLEFSGKYSLTSEISNKLLYLYQKKFILVCYKKEDIVNISLRGEKAKKFVEKILKKIKNSIGGGHEKACGLRIPMSEYDNFKKIVFEHFKK
ncbi:MAG: DHH family phosphoesterase [Candidatus Pacearchaeota archaeon]